MLNISMPSVMGILNITPDSYYDGDRYNDVDAALQRAEQMVAEGVDIIDIGAESSRPGASALPLQQELDRLLPVLTALKQHVDIPVSIDTYKPAVMQAAIELGADIINDIYALRQPGAMDVIAANQVPVVLMHMRGEPGSMQVEPHYDDVISEIDDFFHERLQACQQAGIAHERIILDPGFGFGKTVEHNMRIIQHLDQFSHFNCPLLMGLSRKSSIQKLLNCDANNALFGSLALTSLAVARGASIMRTHDVKATRDALIVTQAVLAQQ